MEEELEKTVIKLLALILKLKVENKTIKLNEEEQQFLNKVIEEVA